MPRDGDARFYNVPKKPKQPPKLVRCLGPRHPEHSFLSYSGERVCQECQDCVERLENGNGLPRLRTAYINQVPARGRRVTRKRPGTH